MRVGGLLGPRLVVCRAGGAACERCVVDGFGESLRFVRQLEQVNPEALQRQQVARAGIGEARPAL